MHSYVLGGRTLYSDVARRNHVAEWGRFVHMPLFVAALLATGLARRITFVPSYIFHIPSSLEFESQKIENDSGVSGMHSTLEIGFIQIDAP